MHHRKIAGSAAFEYSVDTRAVRPRNGLWMYAEISYADSHVSATIQCARFEIFDEAVYVAGVLFKKKKKTKRRWNLIIDGSKGPHRKIVDAHPWHRARMNSYIVVSTRRKTGMNLTTRADHLSAKWVDDDPKTVHLRSHRHSSRGVKIFHGIARYFKICYRPYGFLSYRICYNFLNCSYIHILYV